MLLFFVPEALSCSYPLIDAKSILRSIKQQHLQLLLLGNTS